MTIEQAMQLAIQHHQGRRLAEAERLYRQVLAEQPDHADALHYLGVIAQQLGRSDIAVDLIRRAIALRPDNAEACANLARILTQNGQADEAIAAYRRVIALMPGSAEAHGKLGVALANKGELDEAIAAFRRAVELKPDFFEAHFNLGNALRGRGRVDEAIVTYRQAIVLRPSHSEAYANLAFALSVKGELQEAIAAYRQAIVLKPGDSEVLNNLGVCLQGTGQVDEAITAYRQAIVLKPDYPTGHRNLGSALLSTGQLDEAIAACRRAIDLDIHYAEARSSLIYTVHFHPGYEARAIAEEYRRWNRQHAEPLQKLIRPHANGRNPDRRLRIGYVSPDLRDHPVGRFLLPLLAHRDGRGFEVFAYAQVAAADSMTERLKRHTDGWRSIVGLSDDQAADLIRQDHIDILVDLTMHTANNRLLVFARKPAPVQVTYLAYCSSSGLKAIDYRLSDRWLDPSAGDDSIYSERTIRLPDTFWCYQPHIATPDVGPLPAVERSVITFGSLNSFCKISEPTLSAWVRILRAVAGSQLLLHANEGGHRQRALDRLERDGIERNRVRFVGYLPGTEYFEQYGQIDIALDTFPYAGGTTTCDALWMGVPVVSLAGRTAVGRGGLSILSNVGVSEMVGRSVDEYVRIASELARDVPRLSNLRSTLRQRMERSPLMDAPRFTRGIEAAYRRMWRTWCQASC